MYQFQDFKKAQCQRSCCMSGFDSRKTRGPEDDNTVCVKCPPRRVFQKLIKEAAQHTGCGAAQLVVRRLAVRQARVRISSLHPMESPLAERRRDEDSRRRASANGEG
jgi:hypothetical protein